MNALLRLKHWQLFILLYAIPFVLYLIVVITTLVSQNMMAMGVGMLLLMVYSIGSFGTWMYAVAKLSFEMRPQGSEMRITRFQLALLFPAFYFALLFLIIFYFISNLPDVSAPNPLLFLLIIPCHLISMFCIFYVLYFVAKTFKGAELQYPVHFSDYFVDFILVWFLPVGIWFLQPRINALLERYEYNQR
ncbi:MAG: hypothetical protein ACRCYO_07025 [Bacteroidia bacterium]